MVNLNFRKEQVKENLTPMAKRRKKENSIQINGKTYYLHKIVWEDIVGDSTLVGFEDFKKMKTADIVSIAYILYNDSKYIYTFSSYSDDGHFGDRNIIPKGVVKSMSKCSI